MYDSHCHVSLLSLCTLIFVFELIITSEGKGNEAFLEHFYQSGKDWVNQMLQSRRDDQVDHKSWENAANGIKVNQRHGQGKQSKLMNNI